MSEVKELTRAEKLYEIYSKESVIDLVQKKINLVNELDRILKQMVSIDFNQSIEVLRELDKLMSLVSKVNVSKASERTKIEKSSIKMKEVVDSMNVLDVIVAEKKKMTKSLERLAEISEEIPVIEKVIKDKDF